MFLLLIYEAVCSDEDIGSARLSEVNKNDLGMPRLTHVIRDALKFLGFLNGGHPVSS